MGKKVDWSKQINLSTILKIIWQLHLLEDPLSVYSLKLVTSAAQNKRTKVGLCVFLEEKLINKRTRCVRVYVKKHI